MAPKEETLWEALTSSDRDATWQHMLDNNLKHLSSNERFRLRRVSNWSEENPSEWSCLIPDLTEGLRNQKRGQQKPYRRKGIIGKKGKKIGVHQLAAWIRMKRKPVKEHASHYWCDNHLCANPSHILWESWEENISRYCCKYKGSMNGYFCPHEPTCKGCVPVAK